MSLDLGPLLQAVVDAAVSHALASGRFERVNAHEPKAAPATGGITGAVWVDAVRPLPLRSGLVATSAMLILNVRVYTSFLAQPEDAIDPRVTGAVGALMSAYSGDFDLGGSISEVDLLGTYGVPMFAQAGYLNQDGKNYRVMTITLPCVINDVWDQVA